MFSPSSHSNIFIPVSHSISLCWLIPTYLSLFYTVPTLSGYFWQCWHIKHLADIMFPASFYFFRSFEHFSPIYFPDSEYFFLIFSWFFPEFAGFFLGFSRWYLPQYRSKQRKRKAGGVLEFTAFRICPRIIFHKPFSWHWRAFLLCRE